MSIHSGPRRLANTAAAAWRIVWTAAPREILAVIGLQAAAAITLAVQLVLGKELLAGVTAPGGLHSLSAYSPLLLGLAASMIAAGGVGAVLGELRPVLIELIRRDLEEKIIAVVAGVDIEQLDDPRFHDGHQRAMEAFVDRPWDLMNGIVAAIGAVLSTAAIGVVLLPINPWLLPIALLGAAPLGLASLRNSRVLYARYREIAAVDRQRSYFRDVLTTPRSAAEVRLFGAEEFLLPKYRDAFDRRVQMMRELGRERARRSVLVRVGFAVFGIGLIAVLIQLTGAGTLTIAEAGLAIVVVQQLMNQLRAAASSIESMNESSLFLPDLTAFLATPVAPARIAHESAPTAEDGGSGGESGETPRARTGAVVQQPGSLRVRNVDFGYPGTDRTVLHDVYLEINRGEVVALVGPNGAGKSTLVKLLCGLYAPSAGAVTVEWGGGDERAVSRPELQRLVTAVFQDFGRYALTGRDNIALGEHSRAGEDEALRRAATEAGIASVLARLPMGYDTMLSREFEGGTDLSVGQWQRIALARALFRSAPFMVLDEPTASSDAINERAFLDNLRRTCGDRGILLITHRLSTARRADRAYVIADGRIVESGTHDELSAGGGLYSDLNRLSEGL